MRKVLLTAARFAVVPALLVLGSVTGGVDGFVGWFVLAWLVFRAAPAMWQDTKNAVRWFFGFRRAVGARFFGRRAAAGGDLNV